MRHVPADNSWIMLWVRIKRWCYFEQMRCRHIWKIKDIFFFVVSFVNRMVNLTEYFFSRLLKETVANFMLNFIINMACLKFLNFRDFLMCSIKYVSSFTIFTSCFQKGSSFVILVGMVGASLLYFENLKPGCAHGVLFYISKLQPKFKKHVSQLSTIRCHLNIVWQFSSRES